MPLENFPTVLSVHFLANYSEIFVFFDRIQFNKISNSKYRVDHLFYQRFVEDLDCIADNVDEAWNRLKRNRVVDLDYVLRWSLTFGAKHGSTCKAANFVLVNELNASMVSTVTFECTTCGRLFQGKTEDPRQEHQIRRSLVVGTLLSGGTHATTGELLAASDVPWISFKTFLKDEEDLDVILEEYHTASTITAIEEEKSMVPSDGELSKTTVFVDGCYGTRSYNNKYRSTSGGAVIIGEKSKKILYGHTKSSYCLRCLLNERRGEPVKHHICYKNFDGPAGRMEPKIIVEGLNYMYELGLKATIIVGDGDCNSFDAAKDGTVYGEEIEKQNCRKHATRNLRKHLTEVCIFFCNEQFRIHYKEPTFVNKLRLHSNVFFEVKYYIMLIRFIYQYKK